MSNPNEDKRTALTPGYIADSSRGVGGLDGRPVCF